MHQDYDLAIVGGGLAGNCLALALKDSGLKIVLIEATDRTQLMNSPAGDRALALAAGTVHRLEGLDAWQGINHAATAIKNIHVSDRGHFGKVRLSAQKERVNALGYVITARAIESHLAALVGETSTALICPARAVGLVAGIDEINISLKQADGSVNLTAKLLVGADGGSSSTRTLLDIGQHSKEYGQTALVTTVQSTLPHKNTAFERFTPSGPLALLPVENNQSAVVWTRTDEEAKALMMGSEEDFLEQLQQCFGYKLGRLSLTAPRRAFPLSLIRAEKMVAERAVIIGNAAHQLHPVAGQGFNLGLRDVMSLAQSLSKQHQAGLDIGDADFLKKYAAARQKDHDKVIGFTDTVVRLFSNEWLPLSLTRNIGLALLDHIPAVKAGLAAYAMGLEEQLPGLAKEK